MYELSLLGTVRLHRVDAGAGSASAIRVEAQAKPLAVFLYLALQPGGGCRRDSLLAIFWPESDGRRARNSLSKTLGRLRSRLGADVMYADSQEVGIVPGAVRTDVDSMRMAVRHGDWAEARDLYAGDFLEGFHLADAPAFERWVAGVRNELRRTAIHSFMQLAEGQAASGKPRAAVETLRQTQRMVPADESVAHRLIEVLRDLGASHEALAAYREVADALRSEVGAPPSAALRSLAESIGRAVPIDSLAVVPWANLTGDTDHESVADGFTDLMITELALLFPGRVISRQSVLQLRASDTPLRDVGRLLRVDAVIEGSIARFGEGLTLTAQLLRVEPEGHLWAERVRASIEDLPSVARRMAAAVTDCIESLQNVKRTGHTGGPQTRPEAPAGLQVVHGSGAPSVRPTGPASISPAGNADAERLPAGACEAYLRARHFSNTLSGLERAETSYRECLEIAPGHAPSWAGLASTYAVETMFAVRSPAELFPSFRKAAERAVALDPLHGEAWASLGLYRMLADRDWAGAEEALRRGAQLAAGQAEAHRHLAFFLAAMGRFNEAAAECVRARDRDPIGPATAFTAAWSLYKAGRHAESNGILADLLAMHPYFVLATTYRALNFALLDRADDAVLEATKSMQTTAGSPEVLALAIAALGRAGQARTAEPALARLMQTERERYVDPWAIAIACAGMGRDDEALHWLRRMYDERSPSAFCIRHDPLLDGLRSDARFRNIERRLAFPRPA